MKALTWHGKGGMRCESVPDPKIEHPRDAIIKITAWALVQIVCHPIFGPSDELKVVQWPGSWVCCAKNAFYGHGAVPEMKEGPSEPACRSRLQTAVSCFGPKGRGGERYGQRA